MKKVFAVMFATSAMLFGAANAQENAALAMEQAETLNADEQAFAAKLDEMHKDLFAKMSQEQRAQAMLSSAQPNEAVDANMVAQAD